MTFPNIYKLGLNLDQGDSIAKREVFLAVDRKIDDHMWFAVSYSKKALTSFLEVSTKKNRLGLNLNQGNGMAKNVVSERWKEI